MSYQTSSMDERSSVNDRLRYLRTPKEHSVEKTRPNLETRYITKHLGDILPKCLAELCERRPIDPIEFIALWIFKHRENELRHKQAAAEENEIEVQRAEKEREDELLALGRPEAPGPYSMHRLSSYRDSKSSITSTSERQMGLGLDYQEPLSNSSSQPFRPIQEPEIHSLPQIPNTAADNSQHQDQPEEDEALELSDHEID